MALPDKNLSATPLDALCGYDGQTYNNEKQLKCLFQDFGHGRSNPPSAWPVLKH